MYEWDPSPCLGRCLLRRDGRTQVSEIMSDQLCHMPVCQHDIDAVIWTLLQLTATAPGDLAACAGVFARWR
jgi:hypothetical protein